MSSDRWGVFHLLAEPARTPRECKPPNPGILHIRSLGMVMVGDSGQHTYGGRSTDRAALRPSLGPLIKRNARPFAPMLPEPSEHKKCVEQERLFTELTHALATLVEVQGLQIAALAAGEQDTSRFNEEIRAALSAWERARYAYMEHVMDHGCRFGVDLI